MNREDQIAVQETFRRIAEQMGIGAPKKHDHEEGFKPFKRPIPQPQDNK